MMHGQKNIKFCSYTYLPISTVSHQVANCHSHDRNNLKFDNYTPNFPTSVIISSICWPQNMSTLPTLVPHFMYLLTTKYVNYSDTCTSFPFLLELPFILRCVSQLPFVLSREARSLFTANPSSRPHGDAVHDTGHKFLNIRAVPYIQGTNIGLSLKPTQIRN
jgi:hypothetical protein